MNFRWRLLSHRQQMSKDGQRRIEAVPRTWPRVQAVGNPVQIVLAVHAQVSSLWKILAQQPVGVLARGALPRAVRIAEVHLHAGLGSQSL